ncbi:hypothetical protein B0O80DRAFT_519033, partial [Mortierella sp. GBAus27b]
TVSSPHQPTGGPRPELQGRKINPPLRHPPNEPPPSKLIPSVHLIAAAEDPPPTVIACQDSGCLTPFDPRMGTVNHSLSFLPLFAFLLLPASPPTLLALPSKELPHTATLWKGTCLITRVHELEEWKESGLWRSNAHMITRARTTFLFLLHCWHSLSPTACPPYFNPLVHHTPPMLTIICSCGTLFLERSTSDPLDLPKTDDPSQPPTNTERSSLPKTDEILSTLATPQQTRIVVGTIQLSTPSTSPFRDIVVDTKPCVDTEIHFYRNADSISDPMLYIG